MIDNVNKINGSVKRIDDEFGCPKCKKFVTKFILQKLSVSTSESKEIFLMCKDYEGKFIVSEHMVLNKDEEASQLLSICGSCGTTLEKVKKFKIGYQENEFNK